jgi:hypothetical protein
MRRLMIAVLLLASCRSSNGGHPIDIDVIELVRLPPETVQRRGAPIIQLVGSHDIRVRVKNQSEHVITIHSLKLDPDALDTYTDDPSQTIDREIAPGGEEMFEMILNVDADRNAAGLPPSLDYVKLTMACSDESSNFIETGSHSVTHLRSGS